MDNIYYKSILTFSFMFHCPIPVLDKNHTYYNIGDLLIFSDFNPIDLCNVFHLI